MNELLKDVTEQLQHYCHDEVVALVRDFLAELDEDEQRRFLALVARGPRPVVAESLGLGVGDLLLEEMQELHDAIANDEYVIHGVGFDPEYGTHRGFGDDSWIEEMDDLFAATTSHLRAGNFATAAEAYVALFEIFELSGEGYHFTRPYPDEALRTDVDAMKQNLFIAVARAYPDAVSRAIALSADPMRFYGSNTYTLLDTWQSRDGLMAELEATLIEQLDHPRSQHRSHGSLLPHRDQLLREFYRRHRDVPAYESLAEQIGAQRGWPYHDIVSLYREQQNWEQVLHWTDAGLVALPAESIYRPKLREVRGQALLRLDRPEEAFEELSSLFEQRRTASIYLMLREAAQTIDRWETMFSPLLDELREYVVTEAQKDGYSTGVLGVAGLIGYAYLLEGEWQVAIEWALDPALPAGVWHADTRTTVATGLLRMGLAALETGGDSVVAQELRKAPDLIREHGDRLEPAARDLSGDALLDGAMQVYEHLVEQQIGGKERRYYAIAGRYCAIIRSTRRLQGREEGFDQYRQDLFDRYYRYSALKDEVRKALKEKNRG